MFSIRSMTGDDIKSVAKVHLDTWEATYRGIMSDEYLDGLTVEGFEQKWSKIITDPNLTLFVAEQDGVVCGFVGGGKPRDNDVSFDSEIYAINLVPSAQKLGAGRMLLSALMEKFVAQQYQSTYLWVAEKNTNAIAFYEKFGGEYFGAKKATETPQKIDERLYFWPNVSVLLEKLNKR